MSQVFICYYYAVIYCIWQNNSFNFHWIPQYATGHWAVFKFLASLGQSVFLTWNPLNFLPLVQQFVYSIKLLCRIGFERVQINVLFLCLGCCMLLEIESANQCTSCLFNNSFEFMIWKLHCKLKRQRKQTLWLTLKDYLKVFSKYWKHIYCKHCTQLNKILVQVSLCISYCSLRFKQSYYSPQFIY